MQFPRRINHFPAGVCVNPCVPISAAIEIKELYPKCMRKLAKTLPVRARTSVKTIPTRISMATSPQVQPSYAPCIMPNNTPVRIIPGVIPNDLANSGYK